MIGALRTLWIHNRILLIAFMAAVILALFFGTRAVIFAVHWNDPAMRDQPIQGWMTPRYVAHSWHVPPEVIRGALPQIPDGEGRRQSLSDIAKDTGIPLPDLITHVSDAIELHRDAQ